MYYAGSERSASQSGNSYINIDWYHKKSAGHSKLGYEPAKYQEDSRTDEGLNVRIGKEH